MNRACFEFRTRLSALLSQPGGPGGDGRGTLPIAAELGWHSHLLGCDTCRQLLESEQALEELLTSLPRPTLTDDRRAALVARLDSNLRLEALLDRADPFTVAPVGLAARIAGRIAAQADPLGHLDHIPAPAGMQQRILDACLADGAPVELPASERAKSRAPRQAPLLRHWIPTSLVAAGLAALLWYLPGQNPPGSGPKSDGSQTVADAGNDPVDADLLAVLDSLEVLDLVDELEAEEWELLDTYDQLGLFLEETDAGTGGQAK
ncbi:MAG: hypothetical protein R3F33_01530 [Planctomycetota bacterium]